MWEMYTVDHCTKLSVFSVGILFVGTNETE